ncbi:MAG: ornithine cyclodeaminase [Lachnospiraceae bacterium]|nr:ornithine cyclodeaminase [Lachnospiraceae bacterium]
MSDTRIDFLYLNEQDMIKAGVNDMETCLETMIEVYKVMGEGDYVMGGQNHNSHGQMISFPDNPVHPGMPHNGPDRRFMTMECYIGGKFHIAGEKWYGSNLDNKEKGLPRSILMVMLNDPDTGAPVALESANLLSAMRTGAIPGVGAKVLAPENPKIAAMIAAGAINRNSLPSILLACPTIDTVKIYDIFPKAAEDMKKLIEERPEKYPHVKEVIICNSIEECVKDADIINAATSGKVDPRIEKEWLKPGCMVSLPATVDIDIDFIKECSIVCDNFKMYEAWGQEMGYPLAAKINGMGERTFDYVHDGIVKREDVIDLGEVYAGKKAPRKNKDQIVLFAQGGQATYDVAWGWMCWQKAKELGIGQTLNLWETPALGK